MTVNSKSKKVLPLSSVAIHASQEEHLPGNAIDEKQQVVQYNLPFRQELGVFYYASDGLLQY
jgi:hypothetical protein